MSAGTDATPLQQSESGTTPTIDTSVDRINTLIAEGQRVVDEHSLSANDTWLDQHDPSLALIVGFAHDLRSPIGATLLLAERLRAGQFGPVTAQQERQLGLIYESIFGMSALTGDLLDLARHGTSHRRRRDIVFPLSDLWASVRALVQPIAEERGLLLRWAGPRNDHRIGEPEALRRILLNLVTNALKFTVSGSVTVTATVVGAGSDTIQFSVADTGCGLPLDLAEQLRTAPDAFAGINTSAGLGIAMCLTLLRDLGSRLEIRDNSESGLVVQFALRMPAAQR